MKLVSRALVSQRVEDFPPLHQPLERNTRPSQPSYPATLEHSPKVMRKCLPSSSISTLRPWYHRGLRTSRRIVSRKPAVKQLSDVELLEIINQDMEDAIDTAPAQTDSDNLDSQDRQEASLLTPRVPRLPQSPLTDPGLIAARIRHKAAKPLPSGDRSPFQLKLQKNPYGTKALICGTRYMANQDCSDCISDSTSTMRSNRPSTAKFLPDSL